MSVCPSVNFVQIATPTVMARPIVTKLAHDGPQTGAHPGCARGRGLEPLIRGNFVI